MRIEPLADRVIVKRSEEVISQTDSGIYIPEAAQERPHEGTVVAVGPGKFIDGNLTPVAMKAGDRVLFGKYAGADVKLPGHDDVLILREDEILGIIHDD